MISVYTPSKTGVVKHDFAQAAAVHVDGNTLVIVDQDGQRIAGFSPGWIMWVNHGQESQTATASAPDATVTVVSDDTPPNVTT